MIYISRKHLLLVIFAYFIYFFKLAAHLFGNAAADILKPRINFKEIHLFFTQ